MAEQGTPEKRRPGRPPNPKQGDGVTTDTASTTPQETAAFEKQYADRMKAIEGMKPNDTRMRNEVEVVNHWALTVVPGTSREMLIEPSYWSHVSYRLRPYDEITVRSDDGTLYARYLVLACDRLWARVEELEWKRLTSADVSMSQAAAMARAGYEIKHMGPHLLWCVLRKSDQSRIKSGEPSERDAENWIRQHIRAVGAGL